MKSHVSLLALLLAGAHPAAAQEPPAGDGPRGSSQLAAGEVRYDEVTHATTADLPGISAATDRLPAGSYAEITALDSGRTIVVAIVKWNSLPYALDLSSAAKAALGLSGFTNAVRIRKVVPSAQDVVALREGRAVVRDTAPPALLGALRRKLPVIPQIIAVKNAPATPRQGPAAAAEVPVPRPTPRATPTAKPRTSPAKPAKPATSGYVVQVAALSSAARAATVARAVGGSIVAGPPVWRVRLGPYPDTATAARAKADAARKGYPGGQITRLP